MMQNQNSSEDQYTPVAGSRAAITSTRRSRRARRRFSLAAGTVLAVGALVGTGFAVQPAFAAPAGSVSTAAASAFTGTQAPTISGTPEVGKPLTITAGSDWAPTPDTAWYQWFRSDSATPGGSWTKIVEGASNKSYTPTAADSGKYLHVGVIYAKAGYTNKVWSGGAPVKVASATATPPTSGATTFTGTQAPTISGTPEVGKPLTITAGSDWAPTPDAAWYQWFRSDSATPGGSWTKIVEGASNTSYTPTAADSGKYLHVGVIYAKAGYTNKVWSGGTPVKVASSTTVAPPTATPTPTPTPPTPTPSTSAGAPAAVETLNPNAGSAPLGSTNYAIPAGAKYVSPTAAAGGNGTVSSPYQTLNAALSGTAAGGTIVLRGGEYHENVAVYKAGVTIQAYPGEVVWMDGTVAVTGWVKDGTAWRHTNWNVALDSSPTFTKGAADSTTANWQFVNANYPMAAHPDQTYVDGTELREVQTRAQVVAGTFWVDDANHALVVGTDPTGKTVRSGDTTRALQLRADGVTVRGIGIRRYSTSNPDMGTVTLESTNATLENVIITESATTGLFIGNAGATIRNVTVENSGMLGVGANKADNSKLDRLKVTGSNSEHFNMAPTAGGFKLNRSRGVTITNSDITGNGGTGIWFDVSCFQVAITGTRIQGNGNHGIFFEISSRGIFSGNLLKDNAGHGILINDSTMSILKGNVVSGSGDGNIVILQDNRVPVTGHYGVDSRFSAPDPTMPWLNTQVQVIRNTMIGTNATPLLWSQDYTGARSWADQGNVANGNRYVRTGGNPASPFKFNTTKSGTVQYTTLTAFRAATGQEAAGAEGTTVPATAQPNVTWPDWARTTFPTIAVN
ncbi:right-handed parallel beta-helix repeat-containing protein [Agromyces sp. MMS24-JH15]|uniref:right-handed parallel beta-helix repeat-containing protein n=1 Tax=Agromyces sp. MMS24-JH15 TaxID=3243765 RepID=UPI0037496237